MTTPYYADEHVTLYLGDALAVLSGLPSGSVDCCVTSPPYFGLRDYGVEGQYGLESSPAEYVETMRGVFAEVWRVLADDGTLWLNIGDSYSATQRHSDNGTGVSTLVGTSPTGGKWTGPKLTMDRPAKNLLGIPWRVAFALQDDGWILRRDIIWSKRNVMPEAVTDRPTTSHEYVFLFAKSPRYWYDADAIREESDPEQTAHNERYAKVYDAHTLRVADGRAQPGNVNNLGIHERPGKGGRNARSVWEINTTPFPSAHFAVMAPALAERCILAGCKPAGTVLDPFSGSGTTGLAATKHGRRYVGIDLSAEYLDLSLMTRLVQATLDFGTPP